MTFLRGTLNVVIACALAGASTTSFAKTGPAALNIGGLISKPGDSALTAKILKNQGSNAPYKFAFKPNEAFKQARKKSAPKNDIVGGGSGSDEETGDYMLGGSVNRDVQADWEPTQRSEIKSESQAKNVSHDQVLTPALDTETYLNSQEPSAVEAVIAPGTSRAAQNETPQAASSNEAVAPAQKRDSNPSAGGSTEEVKTHRNSFNAGTVAAPAAAGILAYSAFGRSSNKSSGAQTAKSINDGDGTITAATVLTVSDAPEATSTIVPGKTETIEPANEPAILKSVDPEPESESDMTAPATVVDAPSDCNPKPVPEPASMLAFGMGAALFAGKAVTKKRKV